MENRGDTEVLLPEVSDVMIPPPVPVASSAPRPLCCAWSVISRRVWIPAIGVLVVLCLIVGLVLYLSRVFLP